MVKSRRWALREVTRTSVGLPTLPDVPAENEVLRHRKQFRRRSTTASVFRQLHEDLQQEAISICSQLYYRRELVFNFQISDCYKNVHERTRSLACLGSLMSSERETIRWRTYLRHMFKFCSIPCAMAYKVTWLSPYTQTLVFKSISKYSVTRARSVSGPNADGNQFVFPNVAG